jgi:hypothetical protein
MGSSKLEVGDDGLIKKAAGRNKPNFRPSSAKKNGAIHKAVFRGFSNGYWRLIRTDTFLSIVGSKASAA